jgi:hypothetical protein
MEKIHARRMTFEEVATLEKGGLFLVPLHDRRPGVLVPASLDRDTHIKEREILEAGVPSGQSVPTMMVTSVYGSMYGVPANQIWAADADGEAMHLVEEVGTQVSLVLYAPGMEGPDVLERARKALRNEFGAGILQLRQETHRPVSEDGLPPVLGVPDGQVPRLI